jgi:hypothetical protein
MRSYFRALEVPAESDESGVSMKVENYRDKTVQVFGTFTATLEIEISLDQGNHYLAVEEAITEPGIYLVPQTCTHLRMRNATHVDGTPQAIFGGFDARSDV